MDKKIKDYLHLYLGCECDLVKDNEFHFPHPVTLNAALLGNAIEMPESYKVKPILRPERDITEEENEYYIGLKNNYSDRQWQTGSLLEAEQFRYLLSIGIDLFELIEAGLALDATHLNKEI